MICFSETETLNAAAEPLVEGTPRLARHARPSFAPRPFRGLSVGNLRKHPDRLSRVLRSIASRTENAARPQAIAASPPFPPPASDAPDRSDDSSLHAVAMPQLGSAARPKTTGEDRRRFLRRYSTHLVRVLPAQDVSFTPQELDWALHHSPFRGQMKNISMNGVAFSLNTPLDLSAGVWLRLECRARDFAVIRSAHVTRVVPVSETEWIITCRFDRCVPYADVAQLGQELC